MAEAFFSVSRELVRQGISHTLGWKNTETGLYEEYDIKTTEDISTIVGHFLSNTVCAGNTTVAACFRQFYAQCAYAHGRGAEFLRGGVFQPVVIAEFDGVVDHAQQGGVLKQRPAGGVILHPAAGQLRKQRSGVGRYQRIALRA